ncbi:MAG: PIG-L deacetylase family protein [Bacilli bacterium]
MNGKKYLIVVAHPDDEVLGAGATINKLIKNDNEVNICILCGKAEARTNVINDVASDTNLCHQFLGITKSFIGQFPNIKLNTISHLELVQFIEKAIIESKPDIIITHHPKEVNDDHVVTSLACQAAFRLFQRNPDIKPIDQLLFMEILSSTDWDLDNSFRPNYFIEVGEEGINAKLKAIEIYKGVMRDYPHPRSVETIKALATYRGSQAGLNYAEAFECVFNRVK